MSKLNIARFFSVHILIINLIWVGLLYLLLNSFLVVEILGGTIVDFVTTTLACLWAFAYLPYCFLMIIEHINDYYGISSLDDAEESELHSYLYKRKTGAIIVSYLVIILWIGSLFYYIKLLESKYILPF